MKTPRWLTLNLVSLVALLAVAGLSAYAVAQQASLRRDASFTRQELTSLRDALSQHEAALASDIAAARREAADALAQAESKQSAGIASLEEDFDARLTEATAELSDKLTAVQRDTGSGLRDLSGAMAAAKAQFEVADAALGSKLAEQASSLSSAQAGVNVVRVRLDTLDRNIAAGLSAIDSQLGKQSKDLGAALADVQSARARLDTIDTALAQGLASLDSKLQQDIRDLTDSVDGLRKQATALSERTTTLAEQSARLLLDTPAIHKQVKNAVVQVKVTKAAGEGTGSGFIYGADGRTVVTAHHVIRDALLIRIVTESGQSTFATVLASSQERDVAILRLPAAVSATTLQLGDSDTLEVGQPVVLVGTPLGEPGTVTTGIVSALHRTETYEGYTVRDMVQFDAATNRGNSGGPLLNARGEVVGIAVAGVVPTSGSGINFAVPSNAVAVVLADALR